MARGCLAFSISIVLALAAAPTALGRGKAEHVLLVVLDGMRPDFVTAEHAPHLTALRRDGVWFARNYCVYPSSTNVNGAALATGNYPDRTGIVGNMEFRAAVDAHKAFDTSLYPGFESNDPHLVARYLAAPTVPDLLHETGERTAVAGSKPVAQLFDRWRQRTREAAKKSLVVYRGKILPPSAGAIITDLIGPFPVRKHLPNDLEDRWTTRALTEAMWKEGVPKFSLLWLSEPDLTAHETAPGSPTALGAIKSSDDNLGKVLGALRAKNVLATTDILVVSDHGFSTVDLAFDAAERLRAAGFDADRNLPDNPKPGQVLVVSLGGSVEFYVVDHEPATIRRLVDYLEHSDFAGVIITRSEQEGTFTLAQLHLETSSAPDILVASRWNDRPNEYGIPGQIASDVGRKVGEGTHATFSRFDMNNTLVAGGPDFRHGWTDQTPSGNVDLAPTILSILGLNGPNDLDGRVLTEAFLDAKSAPATVTTELKAERPLGETVWRQTLRLTTVGKTTYFVEGNGGRTAKKP